MSIPIRPPQHPVEVIVLDMTDSLCVLLWSNKDSELRDLLSVRW